MREKVEILKFVSVAAGAVALCLSVLPVSSASAATFTFVTPSGATAGGQPVNASAVFTTSAGQISVTLTDLQANPTAVGQLLSDLSFTISNASGIGATLTPSTAQELTVNGNGTFSTGATAPTGWPLSTTATSLTLDVLAAGGAGPSHLIIGPPGPGDTYSNANGSIAGNGPHNPFLNQTATFVISLMGTTTPTITGATFSFGTTAGVDVVGEFIPLPGALPLFGTAIVGLALLGRRKRKTAV